MSEAADNIEKEAAKGNVKVDERADGDGERKVVFASAHDLRRAFGHRWAKKVMPMVLKELMRHESVTTTEKYYVGVQAQETARHLRETQTRGKKVNAEVNRPRADSENSPETL